MKIILSCLIISLLFSCKFLNPLSSIQNSYNKILSELSELTDEKVQNYIMAIKKLHKLGPNLPLLLAENRGVPNSMSVYEEIEKIILKNGFESYMEFIRVNAKVAWAWNLTQAEAGMENFEKMTLSGLEEIDKALNTPELPQETREELLKARLQILENWEKNQKYAKSMIKLIQPLTNEKDQFILRKYQKELMDAFTGVVYEN